MEYHQRFSLGLGFVLLFHIGYIMAQENQTEDATWTPRNPEIYSLNIKTNITSRFATTLVSARLANNAKEAKEALFSVTLPNEAFITKFAMEIDGKIYDGVVKEKEKAKRQYERARQRGQSAGKVSAQPRDSTKFKVSINVAAHSKINFNLTYQELLQRRLGIYQHVVNINPGQIVRDISVDVFIREINKITLLRVPPLKPITENTIDINTENPLAVIKRDVNTAHITYSADPKTQLAMSSDGLAGQFIVQYDVDRSGSLAAGEIQVIDGYFVHYFAPSELKPVDKRVLFILDKSGSMSGVKMSQVKTAMETILNDLHPGDLFNIVLFSSGVNFWKTSMIRVNADTIKQATDFVLAIHATGGTNINDALTQGIEFLGAKPNPKMSPSMIIFLTDGQPSSGVQNLDSILANVRNTNEGRYTIFSLGFGADVDFPFLRRIALQNGGLARKIYADSDAALQLQNFYTEIATPLLQHVKFKYLGDSVDEETLTGTNFTTYFRGAELIVAGKLNENALDTFGSEIEADGATDNLSWDLNIEISDQSNLARRSVYSNFTERLWAYLTIKKLLNNMEKATNPEEKAAAKERALELSLKYSFVTPLTSMVVTKPEKPTEDVSETQDTDGRTPRGQTGLHRPPIRHRVHSSPPILGSSPGSAPPVAAPPSGHHFRPGGSRFVDNDPHFIVKMDGISESVCFDVNGKPGNIFQLIHDKKSGLVVNGFVVANEIRKTDPKDKHLKTFFGKLALLWHHHEIFVTPHKIVIGKRAYDWKDSQNIIKGDLQVKISKKKYIQITLKSNIVLTVLRHIVKNMHPWKADFLGLYINEGKGLSKHTHGLIGQFEHRKAAVFNLTISNEELSTKKTIATMKVTRAGHLPEKEVIVRLGKRRNMELNTHIPCWHVRNNGFGLIDGHYKDYLVKKLSDRSSFAKRYTSKIRKNLGKTF